mmetsp:Transcript_11521/g.25278  ORF Transcript_11521/g.25278 Transcript_11521/m.25278 type:complete len:88 (-) Transcript_11521:173-436(-)
MVIFIRGARGSAASSNKASLIKRRQMLNIKQRATRLLQKIGDPPAKNITTTGSMKQPISHPNNRCTNLRLRRQITYPTSPLAELIVR